MQEIVFSSQPSFLTFRRCHNRLARPAVFSPCQHTVTWRTAHSARGRRSPQAARMSQHNVNEESRQLRRGSEVVSQHEDQLTVSVVSLRPGSWFRFTHLCWRCWWSSPVISYLHDVCQLLLSTLPLSFCASAVWPASTALHILPNNKCWWNTFLRNKY